MSDQELLKAYKARIRSCSGKVRRPESLEIIRARIREIEARMGVCE